MLKSADESEVPPYICDFLAYNDDASSDNIPSDITGVTSNAILKTMSWRA